MLKKLKITAVLVGLVAPVAAFAYGDDVNCPLDSLHMVFTGNYRTERGHQLREYRCVNGHTTWVIAN